MLKGTLIVNAFLQSDKTSETYEWLLGAAKRAGIDLELRTNAEYYTYSNCSDISSVPDKRDFILYWNKDIPLGKSLESKGIRLFNPSESIRLCDNKALTFEAINDYLKKTKSSIILMPKTIRLPMAFGGIGYTNFDFVDLISHELGYPFIIKECYGSYGGQVYYIDSKEKAVSVLKAFNGQEAIAQEYISSSFGRDIRIYVVGGKVIAAMQRRNDSDFRANIAAGGYSNKITLSKEQEDMAINACKALNLDFAGVDLLYLEDDKPVLCEVNSNAQFTGLFEATGINITDAIMEHIKNSL